MGAELLTCACAPTENGPSPRPPRVRSALPRGAQRSAVRPCHEDHGPQASDLLRRRAARTVDREVSLRVPAITRRLARASAHTHRPTTTARVPPAGGTYRPRSHTLFTPEIPQIPSLRTHHHQAVLALMRRRRRSRLRLIARLRGDQTSLGMCLAKMRAIHGFAQARMAVNRPVTLAQTPRFDERIKRACVRCATSSAMRADHMHRKPP